MEVLRWKLFAYRRDSDILDWDWAYVSISPKNSCYGNIAKALEMEMPRKVAEKSEM